MRNEKRSNLILMNEVSNNWHLDKDRHILFPYLIGAHGHVLVFFGLGWIPRNFKLSISA